MDRSGVLAAVFTASGAMKLVMSKERMIAAGQTGVRDYSLPAIRMIALCELAAVVGLVAPGLIGRAGVDTARRAWLGAGDDWRGGGPHPAARAPQCRGQRRAVRDLFMGGDRPHARAVTASRSTSLEPIFER
jgi:hypothetical protein